MCGHVLLNLFNMLRKRDEMRGPQRILSLLINSIIQEHNR